MAPRSARLLVALAACAACHGSDVRGPTAPAGSTDAGRSLHALFDEEWDYGMREWPTWASSLGDRRFDDRWPEVDVAAYRRRAAHDRDVLARVRRLDRTKLSREDALSFDLFEQKYALAVDEAPFEFWQLAINQRGGIQTADELADSLAFDTIASLDAWNRRLATFGRYVDQSIELLGEASRAKMTHPKVVMHRVVAQIDAQIVADPKKSPFLAPYRKAARALPAREKAEREAAAEKLVAEVVVPAFRRFRSFFVDRYLPACKDDVGAWQWPNGSAAYAALVREHTTTKLTPEEVHAIGLREVARIRREMEDVKARAGFQGTLPEFFASLRTDPRFFFKDGAELLAAYRDLAKQVDPQLVRVFKRLPRTTYGVSPIPDAVAPDTTTAYYREPAPDGSRAGTYFVNLWKPEARPKWEMTALTLHEAVPGHHLQIALAMEQRDIPKFRRQGDYTAFIEGWALYAESLGEEMGLYDDPYAKFGQLTYEMWRAVRLVVDTGIHQLKWSRQRAIDFFKENAPKAELDIVNEVDRYIVWPGQALAYKIGELKIKELRKKKEAELGKRFDLKEFHDVVLRGGALPLDILEREVESGFGKH